MSPSIMGLLGKIPLVECKHDVVAPEIRVHGMANINRLKITFDDAHGYIDKNWGQSFPEKYCWGHITGFKDSSISIQFAKGYPKWLFWTIPVHIGFLKINGKIYTFQSWKKGKMTMKNVGQSMLILKNKQWEINIHFEHDKSLNLRAPVNGQLNDSIQEYIGSKAIVSIYKQPNKKKKQIIAKEVVFGTTVENRF